MRVIKFRGKRVDNGGWVYGSLIDFRDGYYGITVQHKQPTWVLVDPQTIGQFTGLLDKNGKEIYGSDIIEYEIWHGGPESVLWEREHPEETWMRQFQVIYDPDHCQYKIKPIWTEDYQTSNLSKYLYNEGLAVVGNIHDNPELLEKEVV